MIRTFRGVKGLGIAALTMAAAAGCATTPYTTTTPVAVQASTPTVTYNYRTDAELLQANQNAITYCGQYRPPRGPARSRAMRMAARRWCSIAWAPWWPRR